MNRIHPLTTLLCGQQLERKAERGSEELKAAQERVEHAAKALTVQTQQLEATRAASDDKLQKLMADSTSKSAESQAINADQIAFRKKIQGLLSTVRLLAAGITGIGFCSKSSHNDLENSVVKLHLSDGQ